jgi:hypothetical protein
MPEKKEYALIKNQEARIEQAKLALTPQQITFAEWWAVPDDFRIPKSQKDFAEQIGVTEATICNWKRIPEIWTVTQGLISTKSKEQLREAEKVMGELLNCDNAKVRFETAKFIIEHRGEPRQYQHSASSFKDIILRAQAEALANISTPKAQKINEANAVVVVEGEATEVKED